MAQGSKKKYSTKQKRQASDIEASEKKSGKSKKTAERIAWATVNKQDHGGKKTRKKSAKKTVRKSKKKTTRSSTASQRKKKN